MKNGTLKVYVSTQNLEKYCEGKIIWGYMMPPRMNKAGCHGWEMTIPMTEIISFDVGYDKVEISKNNCGIIAE